MQIRLLGRIEVIRDSDAGVASLGGPTQRRLLAVLADHANEVVSVDRLVDILWTDDARPRKAEHNVRTYVHRLRQAIGDDGTRLLTVEPGYQLRLEPEELDTRRFLTLVTELTRSRHVRTTSDTRTGVGEALGIWQGPPFGEFADDPWAQPSRQRLEAAHLDLRLLDAELSLEEGDHGTVVVDATRIATEHPLHEAPQMLRMRALAAAGRRTEALRVFQDFRRHLLEEVGIEPSDAMFELDAVVAAGEPLRDQQPQFAGSYELHECVGAGVSSLVYRATQRSLGREVAVKVIRSELARNPEFIRRFESEARMVARVDHPTIVPLHDFWRDNEQAYLVMRHMRGGTLRDRLEQGPLDVDDTVELVDVIATALDAAHAAHVVHRDLKPANILYDSDGRPSLGDFGIALDLTGDHAVVELGTAGSPLSPELLRNEPVGPAADIHGLGILTHTALAGRSPFQHVDPEQRRQLWAESRLPSLAGQLGYSDELDRVLRIATHPDPAARYATGHDFAAAFRTALEQPAAPPDIGPTRNPYRGLDAFEEPDARWFFGRDQVVGDLVARLRGGDRLLAVVGPSGSGKSSVLRSGLLARLRDDDALPGSSGWFTTVMTPGPDAFASLSSALERVATGSQPALHETIAAHPRGLSNALEHLHADPHATTLIVIDQFEEVFTRADGVSASRFLEALTHALTAPDLRVRIAIGLRADFYDRPLGHPSFAPLLRSSTLALTPLTTAELHDVVERPAAEVGVELETGLSAELVSQATGEQNALPMLQFVLTTLFEQRTDRTMTWDAYRSLGGLGGAIGHHAEGLWHSLDTGEKVAVRRLLTQLVVVDEDGEFSSRRRPVGDLLTNTAAHTGLDLLAGARLISIDVDPTNREPTAGISHEALLGQWARLRGWLEEDRATLRTVRMLQEAAATWNTDGQAETDLYRGVRLDAAAQLIAETPELLSEMEHEFVEASLSLRAREEREAEARLNQEVASNARLRRALIASAVLVVVALIAGALAFNQRSTALAAETDAVEARDAAVLAQDEAELARDAALQAEANAAQTAFDAETGRLVATAASLAEANPRAAMLVAVAAHQRAQTPETLGALQTALSAANPLVGWLGAGVPYTSVEWVAPTRVVATRVDGLDLFDTETGDLLDQAQLDVGEGRIARVTNKMRTDAGGNIVAVADGPNVAVFRVDDRLTQVTQLPLEAPVVSVAVRPDGERIATTDQDSVVTIWTSDGALLSQLDVDDFPNIYEQASVHLGDVWFFSDFFSDIPVFTTAYAEQSSVTVVSSTEIRQFNWELELLSGPHFTFVDVGPQGDGIAVAMDVAVDGSGVLIGDSAIWTAPLAGGEDSIEFANTPAFGGAGNPNLLEHLGTNSDPLRFLLNSGAVVRLDPQTYEPTMLADIGLETATAATLDPADSNRVAVASPFGIAVLSLTDGGPIATGLVRNPEAGNTSIARDGRFAAAGGTGNYTTTSVWKREDGGWTELEPLESDLELFAQIPPDRTNVLLLGGSPDEQTAYSLDGDHPERVGSGRTAPANSGDGSWELGVSVYGGVTVDVYSLASFELQRSLPKPGRDDGRVQAVSGVRFNADASQLLISMPTGESELWDTSTWTRIDDPVIAAADIAIGWWSEDGELFATASAGGVISIRDGQTHEVIRELIGAVGTTNTWNSGGFIFSQDNSLLLSNFDGPGRLWDVATGQQIGVPFVTHPQTNSGVNYGETLQLITATEQSAVVWNLDVATWPATACRAAGSTLTEAEWAQWGPRDQAWYDLCP